MATLVPFPSHTDALTDKDGGVRLRKIFVRDLLLHIQIGVYASEHGRTQKVRINVELDAVDRDVSAIDELESVVCYQQVVDDIKTVANEGHVKLVETLAERIAKSTLQHTDVHAAKIRVEKLEAVEDASAVGIEIIRQRTDYYPDS
ncbi:MAG: dihydroneopterin aldolase [Sphingomonadales bacterium]|jgi:dihydroneopterin aldolase